MDTGNLVALAIGAAVTTLVGLLVVLVWRAAGRAVEHLAEIARLPDLVLELIHELGRLGGRVDRLENYLPDHLHVSADLNLTTPPR